MARDQFRSSWYDLPTDGRFNIHCAVCMFGCPETQLSCAGAQAVYTKLRQTRILRDSTLLTPNLPCAKGHSEIDHCFTKVRNPDTVDFPELDHFYLEILFK